MEPFTLLRAVALPIAWPNVDTDQILPARFLQKARTETFGAYLFRDLRYFRDGTEDPDFVMNRPPYRTAQLLVGRENFGCGSSREHAVWALRDFGIRAVIAEVVTRVGKGYPDVELTHMFVDAAAMELMRAPTQFDVIVTGNMFGDILSDVTAMLTGSIGMLPSASLAEGGKGLYEPVHGSAPDIAGRNIANPLGAILSVGMMLRYSFDEAGTADRILKAVRKVLAAGYRTADIIQPGMKQLGTRQMGDAVVTEL